MVINNINYQIIGTVYSEKVDRVIPVLDIPMMSDEKWIALTNTPEQIERRKQRSMQKDGECHG